MSNTQIENAKRNIPALALNLASALFDHPFLPQLRNLTPNIANAAHIAAAGILWTKMVDTGTAAYILDPVGESCQTIDAAFLLGEPTTAQVGRVKKLALHWLARVHEIEEERENDWEVFMD